MLRSASLRLLAAFLLTLTSARVLYAAPPEHFLFYAVKPAKGVAKPAPFAPVTLTDGLRTSDYTVTKPLKLGLPADKNGGGVLDPATHLVEYQLKPAKGADKFKKLAGVIVTNQCNDLHVELAKPVSILVPAVKSLAGPTPAPTPTPAFTTDHFLCYAAKPQKKLANGTQLPPFPKAMQVDVTDQFQTRRYDLKKLTKLCLPVDKSGSPVFVGGPAKGSPAPITPATISNPDDPLLCYQATLASHLIPQTGCGATDPSDPGTKITPKQAKHEAQTVFVTSQFGSLQLEAGKEAELCIPSQKNLPVVAVGDTFPAVGNTFLEVGVAPAAFPAVRLSGSVLDNDHDPDGGVLQVTGVSDVTPGASVTMNANGSFTYLPPAGFTGPDTFNYGIINADPISATVKVVVNDVVRYVDDAATGPTFDGRAASPFATLLDAQTASGVGDTIYLFAGNAPYGGGITLKNDQALVGQGVDLVVENHLLSPAQAISATITNSGGHGVVLGKNNAIGGFEIANPSGAAIFGTDVGATLVNHIVISNTADHGIAIEGGKAVVDAVTIHDAGSDASEGGIIAVNTDLTIRNSIIDGAGGFGVATLADAPLPLTVAITDTVVSDYARLGPGSAILMQTAGKSKLTTSLVGNDVTAGSQSQLGVLVSVQDTSTFTLTLRLNTFDAAGAAGAGGLQLQASNGGVLRVDAISNTIDGTKGPGITVFTADEADALGRITGNAIIGDPTGTQTGLTLQQQGNGLMNFLVDSNVISATRADPFFFTNAGTGAGAFHVTVTNNDGGAPVNSGHAFRFQPLGNEFLCADIRNNLGTGNGFAPFGLAPTGGNIGIDGFTTGDLAAYLSTNNFNQSFQLFSGAGTIAGSDCLPPQTPLP